MVCASHRQAQALQLAFAHAQIARGAAVWETPRIVGFAAFVDTLADASLPPVLGDAEARVLWRICVDESRGGEPLLRAADAGGCIQGLDFESCAQASFRRKESLLKTRAKSPRFVPQASRRDWYAAQSKETGPTS
ncbi:MAG TPA: hypothetical protein VFM56_15530 [Solimonas sp.]|nr:hypothetical protein [Solimonas sp.]